MGLYSPKARSAPKTDYTERGGDDFYCFLGRGLWPTVNFNPTNSKIYLFCWKIFFLIIWVILQIPCYACEFVSLTIFVQTHWFSPIKRLPDQYTAQFINASTSIRKGWEGGNQPQAETMLAYVCMQVRSPSSVLWVEEKRLSKSKIRTCNFLRLRSLNGPYWACVSST